MAVGAGRGGGRAEVCGREIRLGVQDIRGHGEQYGAGAATDGAADRLVRDLRQALGAPHFHRPLNDVGEKGRQSDLLKCFFVAVRRFHLAN